MSQVDKIRYDRWDSDQLTDFYLEAARGRINGVSTIHKFGLAEDIDVGDGIVDIWDGAANDIPGKINPYNWIENGPVDIQVSSSSAADVGISITGEGLNELWELEVGSAILDGQNAVIVGFDRQRIFRAYVNGPVEAQGFIYISDAGTPLTAGVPDDLTKVRALIHPESQQTQMALYTVPAGYELYITHGWANISKASTTEAIVTIKRRDFGGIFRTLHTFSLQSIGSSGDHRPYVIPIRLDEKTDLIYRARVYSNSTAISAGFHGMLIRK